MKSISSNFWKNIHTLVFDFDGIFTDNKVYVDQNGIESVKCDRSDGLALDLLRVFIKKNKWDLDYFILSTEKNHVVKQRATKMKIKCYQGISCKLNFLKEYILNRFNEDINSSSGILYLGNDINDYEAIKFSGYSISPNNSHEIIKKASNFVYEENGGDGFVRAVIEDLINLK